MSLSGKKVVFTGFRDEDLKSKIVSAGGVVTASVSSVTNYLIVGGPKGKDSEKAKAAAKLGVEVVTKDAFNTKFFAKSPSFLGNLFGPKKPKVVIPSFPSGWPADVVKGATSYLIHDNGSRPFKVSIKGKTFEIHKCVYDHSNEDSPCTYAKQVLKPTKFSKVFVGRDKNYGKKFDGNSLLFELPGKSKKKLYMFVGQDIYTIEVDDEIKEYASPVYGSDVAYPFGIGGKNTYCFLERAVLPNALLTVNDPYLYMYGDHLKSTPKLKQKFIKETAEEYRFAPKKQIHDRFNEW